MRPLLVRPDLHHDEWLQTAISRWAYFIYRCSRQQLLNAMGLGTIPSREIEALGVALQPDTAHAISVATGIPTHELHLMTTAGRNRATWEAFRTSHDLSDEIPGLENHFAFDPWTKRESTRWCPICLAERPGVYLRTWRLPWTYLCLQHLVPLEDVCPQCGKPPRTTTGRTRELWDPTTCRNNLSGTRAVNYCGADLTNVPQPVHLAHHPHILRAAITITRLCHEPTRDNLELLHNIRHAIGVLRTTDAATIADLAGVADDAIVGLIEPEVHPGSTAPTDAWAFAVLAAGAWRICLDDPAPLHLIRRLTFERPPAAVPRDAGHGPGSATELVHRWGGITSGLRARVLHAIDQDLAPKWRIRERTAQEDLGSIERTADASRIPELLWPEWSTPLHVGAGTNLRTIRSVFAAALGNGPLPEIRSAMLGTAQQRAGIIHNLAALGLRLDREQPPIDYGRRRGVAHQHFLIEADWVAVCKAAGFDPGRGRRHELGRRYALARFTGSAPSSLLLPGSRSIRTPDYTSFLLTITAELQQAVDLYLEKVLLTCFAEPIAEPVVWSPPRSEQARRAAGRELDDIDLHRAYHLVSTGRSIEQIAHTVQRSVEHTALALETWPRSSGKPTPMYAVTPSNANQLAARSV